LHVLCHHPSCGWFSDADLAVLTTTIDQDLSVYVSDDVEFAPSRTAFPNAMAPCMTSLQAATPSALTRPSDTRGHLQRSISHSLNGRAFPDLAHLRP
jgi:hypothetical protein